MSNTSHQKPSPPSQSGSPIGAERRECSDRRRRPTPMLSRYTFFGRRRRNRRVTDPNARYYVDWIGGNYLLALIAILLLIGMDTISTLHIIACGGGEANPLMRSLIERGPFWFALVKIGTGMVGFLLLAVHRFFPLARMLVLILLSAYGGIAFFHLFLLSRIYLT